jgi:hypothetical protein
MTAAITTAKDEDYAFFSINILQFIVSFNSSFEQIVAECLKNPETLAMLRNLLAVLFI